MKALTLHQPWASLIATGRKTIETRSWSTKHRGPLAIHAGKRRMGEEAQWLSWNNMDVLSPQMGFDTSIGFGLPEGAVVAIIEVVDVVPMVDDFEQDDTGTDPPCLEVYNPFPHEEVQRLTLWDSADYWTGECEEHDVTNQRTYGDFAPGRFAWLFDNFQMLDDPITATGHQLLWEWPAGDLPEENPCGLGVPDHPHNRWEYEGHFVPIGGAVAGTFIEDDVAEVLAVCDDGGEYGEGAVCAVIRLRDGRFVAWESFIDVTGRGFSADAYGGEADVSFALSFEEIVQFGLTDEGRERLGLTAKSGGIDGGGRRTRS